jgi:hypothetical protein
MASSVTRQAGTGMARSEDLSERLRHLAGRCRDLSDVTAVPEVVKELTRIATALEDEAELVAQQ